VLEATDTPSSTPRSNRDGHARAPVVGSPVLSLQFLIVIIFTAGRCCRRRGGPTAPGIVVEVIVTVAVNGFLSMFGGPPGLQ
jgi:hypothetical protein